MKKYFYILILLLAIESGLAQTKPKQSATEQSPTQSEMQELMKEAQSEMDKLSDEDKKAMEEMGIKVPSFNDVPDVSDQQLKEAYENEMRIVPVLDNERIASISKIPLSDAQLPAYLEKIHMQLGVKLGAGITAPSEKVYQWLKNEYKTATAVGNSGVGCWMMGKPELALYLLSKACIDDPTDADNLNNFSALLTMSGAEQLAIPLLNKLNSQFPDNSTILNNIGQAWFGLGDITKAQSYLDSAIRLCAYHPQANVTKSFIQESKGEKEEAVESMKRSVREAYSSDKEDRLRSLGYNLDGSDITWNFKPNPDPLGLGNFNHPAFPISVEQSVALEIDWQEFRGRCEQEIESLNFQLQAAEARMTEADNNRINENVSFVQNAVNTGNPEGQLTLLPFYAAKAMLKLKEMDKDGGNVYRIDKATKALAKYLETQSTLKQAYFDEMEKIAKEDAEQTGEGLPNEDFCPRYKGASDKFLMAYNPEWQQLNDDYLDKVRLQLNESMYWYQYIQWPEQFEVSQIGAKIAWLQALRNLDFESITKFLCVASPMPKGGKLGSFDDMHCMYHSESNLLIGKIISDCSKLEAKLDLDLFKKVLGVEVLKIAGKFKQGDKDGESFLDQFQSGSVEVGLKKTAGMSKGPLKAEAKLGGTGFVEIGKKGITDAGVKVVAEINLGTDVVDKDMAPIKEKSITIIGTESKLSIGGGYTNEVKVLKGI